ncbi:serpin family protein [Polycyclovorans algicola]|uniref:serpin family protein n=1 Tax=Polycyclovorans algicola TaxID=616992 RepID=UPI0004A729ED|nr:serpin family protein [Polycyclovorans algicola]
MKVLVGGRSALFGRAAALGLLMACAVPTSHAAITITEVYQAEPEFVGSALLDLSQRWFDPAVAQGNQLYSALSLGEALGMAALTARGRTQDAFAQLLYNEPRWARGREIDDLMYPTSPLPPGLKTAYAFIVAEDLKVRTDIETALKTVFGAEVMRLDFASPKALQTVNTWFSKETAGHMPDMLSALPQQGRFILANALHFKAAWATPFQAGQTADAPFKTGQGNTLSVAMMRQTLQAPLQEVEGWRAISLAFEGDRFDLLVALPPEGQTLAEAAFKAPVAQWVPSSTQASKPRWVDLQLPRFRLTQGGSVRQRTLDLGLAPAYEACADFSNLSDENLHLGDIVHRVMLSVDEHGAEAAAATAVTGSPSTAPSKEAAIPFVVDRPFMVWLIHRPTGIPVMTGAINTLK